MSERLPRDLEAEKAVLGAVFLDSALFDTVAGILDEDDFCLTLHRWLYHAFKSCVLSGRLDPVTLSAELEKSGQTERERGLAYAVEAANALPSLEHAAVREYAGIVKDCAVRRELILKYEEAAELLRDRSKSVAEVTDGIQAAVMRSEKGKGGLVGFGELFCDFSDELERRFKQGGTLDGLETGYKTLDILTGGLERGKLYVIGARPAMGKTALALNITAHTAAQGKTAAFFSLEMQRREVIRRVISCLTSIKSYCLKTAAISSNDLDTIAGVLQKVGADDLLVDDRSYQSAQTILRTCVRENNRLKRAGRRIELVVIDYLQLMAGSDRRMERRAVIEENSRMCKVIAKTLDCPVILLSQLSRANEARQNKRPVLSDLRESGGIEQDADVVAFIHREEYYDPKPENAGWAEVIIAKNRDGEIGTVKLGWDSTTTTFFTPD